MRIQMIIKEKGVSKARPRFNTRTGRTYTPSKTRDFETMIGDMYNLQGFESFESNPIRVQISFHFEPPKSWSNKKRREALEGKHIPTKNDLDNMVKAVTDGLNGIAYSDDRYICELLARKLYADEDMIVITIENIISYNKKA